mgnify:FL=1
MDTYKTQHNAFNMAIIMVYILTVASIFGLSSSAPAYLNTLNTVIHIYIGIFLLYRFNPFIKTQNTFSELDRRVAFSAGVFIAMTSILGMTINTYLKKTTEHTKNLIKPH